MATQSEATYYSEANNYILHIISSFYLIMSFMSHYVLIIIIIIILQVSHFCKKATEMYLPFFL